MQYKYNYKSTML